MTRKSTLPNVWALRDAKARFSEVVRKAKTGCPQRITVHGKEEVVVISMDEYRRKFDARTGADLIKAMQACPYPDFPLERDKTPAENRDVDL